MLVTPTMNDKARGFVVTRSFGAAVFIHASGHRPLRVHSTASQLRQCHQRRGQRR